MKRMSLRFLLPVLAIVAFASCNDEEATTTETKEPVLKEESITYTGDSIIMNGFVVYDENIEEIIIWLSNFIHRSSM